MAHIDICHIHGSAQAEVARKEEKGEDAVVLGRGLREDGSVGEPSKATACFTICVGTEPVRESGREV